MSCYFYFYSEDDHARNNICFSPDHIMHAAVSSQNIAEATSNAKNFMVKQFPGAILIEDRQVGTFIMMRKHFYICLFTCIS